MSVGFESLGVVGVLRLLTYDTSKRYEPKRLHDQHTVRSFTPLDGMRGAC